MTADISGLFLPVPTVFDHEGELDVEVYGALIDHYVGRGVDALFLMGPFGQGAAMNVDQRKLALEVALDAAAGRVPVAPNISAVDLYTARDLARHAADSGAASLAMIGPYYYSDRTPSDVVTHFRMINDGIGLPLFIYNDSPHQGYSINPRMMEQIKQAVPGLFGMMTGNPSLVDALRYHAVLGDSVRIFAAANYVFPGMTYGFGGALNPPFAFSVEAAVALVAATRRGDVSEALRLQLAMLRFLEVLESFTGSWGGFRPGQLEGLRYLGFPVKMFPRWPTDPIGDADRDRLHAAIDEIRAAALPAG